MRAARGRRRLYVPCAHAGNAPERAAGRADAAPQGGRGAGRRAERAAPVPSSTADRRARRGQGSDDGEDQPTPGPPRRQAAGEGRTRSAAETEKIRVGAGRAARRARAEYDQTLTEITELQRDRLTDSAGDDQADTGTKTFEREQEISLANNILERITQVERALERLDEGGYGWCERCGNPIPVERLAAFPSATLCVTCKQLEERR